MAYVYIRQSTLMQVTRHAESTDLQYSLVERAVALGWPRERVELIDEDLGKSGAQAEARGGFQRLLAEISLASVRLVLSFDASRLARNNHDWYQLLEVCSIFGTLIADGERLYDPRLYHDRLLLGLTGMMSEAELHHLKQRMHAGARHKAERGELHQGLPVGLARGLGGEVILNPDEEVQARIRLVFEKFREIRSAGGVMRYLQETRLPLPARPLRGPAPHGEFPVYRCSADQSQFRGTDWKRSASDCSGCPDRAALPGSTTSGSAHTGSGSPCSHGTGGARSTQAVGTAPGTRTLSGEV